MCHERSNRPVLGVGLCVALAMIACPVQTLAAEDEDLLATFATRYQALVKARYEPFSSSWANQFASSPAHLDLARMGAPIVPLLVDMAAGLDPLSDTTTGPKIAMTLETIIKVPYPSFSHDVGFGGARQKIVAWWKSREQVPGRFAKYYAEWKQAKAKGHQALHTEQLIFDDARKSLETKKTLTPLGEAYAALRGLGIDALPHVVAKLKQGDADLLPLFGELTGSSIHLPASDPVEERARRAVAAWENQEWSARFRLPPASAARPKKDK